MKLQTFLSRRRFNNIREFFWPLLDPEELNDTQNFVDNTQQIEISNSNLELAFKMNSKILEDEEDRRKSIESKAALFLSTISIASSLVVAANSMILSNQSYNLIIKFSVIISFILSLYAARTVWFSVKALERGYYSVIGFEDINVSGPTDQYYKHLIECQNHKIKKNQATINTKVDYLTLAQEYYKRAIVIICIYAFFALCFSIFISKDANAVNGKTITPSILLKKTN